MTLTPPLQILLIIALGLVVTMFFKNAKRQAFCLLLTSLIATGVALRYLAHFLRFQEQFESRFFEMLPDVPFSLKFTAPGFVLLVLACFLFGLTAVFSVGYFSKYEIDDLRVFFFWLTCSVFATVGLSLSANLLTLYIWYEILSLTTYPLVTYQRDEAALKAGRRYLTYIMGGSILLVLPAIGYTYTTLGHLNFDGSLGKLPLVTQGILMLCFTYGFTKAAVMPLHGWLPGAMVAPTPVSALLHAVAVVKAGVFSIGMVWVGMLHAPLPTSHFLFELILLLCTSTCLISAIVMIFQDDLKKCLAFSTIGQLSMILMAFFMATPVTIQVGFAHIMFHGVGKITLFFVAGAIYVATGQKKISRMQGFGRSFPLIFMAFLLGSMNTIGLPFTAGFITKWGILKEAFAEHYWFIILTLAVATVAKTYALLRVTFYAFFKPYQGGIPKDRPKNFNLVKVPLLVTAVLTVVLFFYPNTILQLTHIASILEGF